MTAITQEIPVYKLSELLTCSLCNGFYREAHTIAMCLHTFCKVCIYKHVDKTNVRGNVHCPECNTDLKIVTVDNIMFKIMYDGNLQRLVDKIFPHFSSEDRRSLLHFSLGSQDDQDDQDEQVPLNEQISDRFIQKRTLQDAEEDATLASKRVRALELNDVEVSIKISPFPCTDTGSSASELPKLTKDFFKAKMSVKLKKVREFIYRRMPEALKVSLPVEDIELLSDTNHVLDASCTLNSWYAEVLRRKPPVYPHLFYRRKHVSKDRVDKEKSLLT